MDRLPARTLPLTSGHRPGQLLHGQRVAEGGREGGSEPGRLRKSGCLSLPQLGLQPVPDWPGAGARGLGAGRAPPTAGRTAALSLLAAPGPGLVPGPRTARPLSTSPPTSGPPDPLLGLGGPARPFPEVEKAAWWKTRMWPQPDRSPPPSAVRSSYCFSDSCCQEHSKAPTGAASCTMPPAAPGPVLPKGGLRLGKWQAGLSVPVSGPGTPILAPRYKAGVGRQLLGRIHTGQPTWLCWARGEAPSLG